MAVTSGNIILIGNSQLKVTRKHKLVPEVVLISRYLISRLSKPVCGTDLGCHATRTWLLCGEEGFVLGISSYTM